MKQVEELTPSQIRDKKVSKMFDSFKFSVRNVTEIEKIRDEYELDLLLKGIGNVDGLSEIEIQNKMNKILTPEIKEKNRLGRYLVYCKIASIEFNQEEYLDSDMEEVQLAYNTFRLRTIAT